MGMGFTMGLNFILLVAMVATNILSLYHLSTTTTTFSLRKKQQPPPLQVPDHLLKQLHTIRATINHLTRLHPHDEKTRLARATPPKSPSDLITLSALSPIASSCHDHPELLYKYMNYTPYTLCPKDSSLLGESLIIRGCHPLPRRRCFSRTPSNPNPSSLDANVVWENYGNGKCKSFKCLNTNMGFDFANTEAHKFMSYKSDLDLTIPQLMDIAKRGNSVLRLGVDIGGGTGTFGVRMKERNVTVLTTTLNWGGPYSEANAGRGVLSLHAPLQQRLPVFDGVVDLVRCGRAVNRWIPLEMMEFMLYDVDRVLRGGGYLWIDHFFSKELDLEKVYKPLINRLGYKIVKWATGIKNDASGVKHGEVYLTALLQKPKSR